MTLCIEAMCNSLIEYQNCLDELSEIEKKPSRCARGFWKIDLQHIANQISESISGPLKDLSLDGAIDQWITNEDFMLDSNKLKLLSVIFTAKVESSLP